MDIPASLAIASRATHSGSISPGYRSRTITWADFFNNNPLLRSLFGLVPGKTSHPSISTSGLGLCAPAFRAGLPFSGSTVCRWITGFQPESFLGSNYNVPDMKSMSLRVDQASRFHRRSWPFLFIDYISCRLQ
jgi:hypothetical protein